MSSSILAGCGYILEDTVLSKDSYWMEFVIKFSDLAIGFTLVVIGTLGLSECLSVSEACEGGTGHSQSIDKHSLIPHDTDIESNHSPYHNYYLDAISSFWSRVSHGYDLWVKYASPNKATSFPNLTSPNANLYKLLAVFSAVFMNGLLL